ncbi:MAG TPA: helix-turn-helix domain-containing protein [Sphingomonas sp.]
MGVFYPDRESETLDRAETENDAIWFSRRFGVLVRQRRKAMGLTLGDLATVAGVGIRFVHELERGKPTCQIGRALVVAGLVGLDPVALLERQQPNAGGR